MSKLTYLLDDKDFGDNLLFLSTSFKNSLGPDKKIQSS